MSLNNWKKRRYNTNPPSIVVYEKVINGNLRIIWVNRSNQKATPFRVGGVNKRGYITDEYFKTRLQALNYIKQYMRTH